LTTIELTPDQLLTAYANGYFPMALTKDDPELYWFSPRARGVMPLESFNIPRGLARSMKKHPYTVTVDTAFEAVIRACGTITKDRHETWINETIVQLYTRLFEAGHAHSIEVWKEEVTSRQSPVASEEEVARVQNPDSSKEEVVNDDAASSVVPLPLRERLGEGSLKLSTQLATPLTQPSPARGEGLLTGLPSPPPKTLIGGLYGVSLGGAFFGESMFSRATDASKIALVHLVEILRSAEYQLLDTQYVNEHLKQFGVEAWSKERYMTKLAKALSASPNPSTRFSTASVRSGAASSSSVSVTSPS
jgi:Leu/Phe-tRNA-protein transferase